MRIERISGKEERRILIGMIVDPVVCGRIASKWAPTLFQSSWANIVGDLCVRFHNQYSGAPGKAIEGLFEAWATEKNRDKETVALVEKFLSSLSDEYEDLSKEINAPFLIDLAGKHFTRVRLTHLAEAVMGEVDQGEVEKASKRVNEYGAVELGAGSGIDVLQDPSALEKAFAEKEEPLLILKGALGRFFGHSLTREGFISFLAPEKRGKTWWLCELSWQAMLQRRRVAFFSVGDESEEDMMLRFAVRASRWPLRAGIYKIPTRIYREEGAPKVDFEERDFQKPLSYQRSIRAFEKVAHLRVKSTKSYLRLSVHPNSSLSVKGMESQLKIWEKDGWVPDIIVVDYMDILQESGSGDDVRHRINQTWKDFRGLTQRWHALGITATQADAASYNNETLDKSNFSEDKRKLSHVTGMIGINQTDDEKEAGIMRLNWIVRRGDYFNTKACVFVAGNLGLGAPVIKSTF